MVNRPVSPLRHVLQQILQAQGGLRLEEIAARAGVAPDEAASMVEFWIGRGVLTREAVNGGCAPAGCGGCALATACSTARRAEGGTAPSALHVIRPARSGDDSTG
ncbi:FeoC-like transcriptional regulator [Streptomyces sp. NPDC001262]|uniref:FeoC-like transcriptional regulator n=1 Tax=Streptomyces sp. NPDC001262 TaxID=3364552 RepID=UPI003693D1CE